MEEHNFDFGAMRKMRKDSFNDDEIMEFIGVGKGMSVLDLGTGDGFFAKMFADRNAAVTAVDKNDQYFDDMNDAGVSTKKADICGFNEGTYDIVFMANVLHDLDCKDAVAKSIYSMDKGILAIIEFKRDAPFGPPVDIRLSPEDVSSIFKAAGFKQSRMKELRYHYIMVFEK